MAKIDNIILRADTSKICAILGDAKMFCYEKNDKGLKTCTIKLVIELLDVYDNGIDVIDEFICLKEEDKIKAWLYNDVKLGQYYDAFIEHGIEEITMVQMLTEESLVDMGIDNDSHLTRILIAIVDLYLHSH